MSSSAMTSQGVVFATAMALSGTVILIALRLQKSLPPLLHTPHSSPPVLRSCISSERKKGQKKKKRVHFAEDVVDSRTDGQEFRRKHRVSHSSVCSNSEVKVEETCNGVSEVRGMPANRKALYNGILRDRVAPRRLAYSY
ncbi:uncharacterized protein LOC129321005 isoform X2 [Prosopis cineraria]|uniref:uncharacterized protein LOC129297696 isoform X2 n=1 Tax=Prosopis cineraria TaxID=364024 RepID=UPI0024108AC9|nr:uncharacterized protein LOC129297696 isoform X2 [Prosopis cineraria]XP_054822704.1 uncharacterized protein LOC129321005 isoform X2 [Prosopis cineraria]